MQNENEREKKEKGKKEGKNKMEELGAFLLANNVYILFFMSKCIPGAETLNSSDEN